MRKASLKLHMLPHHLQRPLDRSMMAVMIQDGVDSIFYDYVRRATAWLVAAGNSGKYRIPSQSAPPRYMQGRG